MIRSLFIPDNLGMYYTFAYRIVGIEITKNAIFATVVKAYGLKRSIEHYIREPIETDEAMSLADRTVAAFERIKAKIGPHNALYVALPSTGVVFKELMIPFVDLEKIKMIIPFEIEPLLPFALHDAVIDCIVLEEDKVTQKTDVLAAAVKYDVVQETTALFERAGLVVHKITVDVLELYGLYKSIPEYVQLRGIVVIIDIGASITRLEIIVNGILKTIRVLPKGIVVFARNVMGVVPQSGELEDWFIKLNVKDLADAQKTKAREFFADVQFTLQATLDKLPHDVPMNKILLAGGATEIIGMSDLIHQIFDVPCELFYAHKVIQNGTISAKNQIGIQSNFIISLATALSSPTTEAFNLRKRYMSPREEKVFDVQLLVAAALTLGLVLLLIIYVWWSLRVYENEVNDASREAANKIVRVFNLQKVGSLERANSEAETRLMQEENVWFALSTHNRFSFLTYLQELSSRLDRQALGLDLKRMVLKSNDQGEDVLILEGSVKSYDALRSLEEALHESQLFKEIPKLQEPKFGAITLIFDKSKGTP